jgi:hypothetical protein
MNSYKLYQKVKGEGISHTDIKAFIKEQTVGQLFGHRPRKHYYPITAPPHSYQADLIFFKNKHINNGYNAALTLIEITSRMGFCYLMKGKKTPQVMQALGKFYGDVNKQVTNLTTDRGSEFKSREFNAWVAKHKIRHFLADERDHSIMGMIERFNGTIKTLINKYMAAYSTKKFIDALPNLLFNYNNTVHSSIGYAPVNVTPKEGALIRIEARKRTRALDKRKNINVGDSVRVRQERGLFEKAGKTWSDKVYSVLEDYTKTFVIDDNTGRRHKHYNLMKIVDPPTDNPFRREVKSKDVETKLAAARSKRGTKEPIEHGPHVRPKRATRPVVKAKDYVFY